MTWMNLEELMVRENRAHYMKYPGVILQRQKMHYFLPVSKSE
jgi:hypothetical protein